jgi:hypothetical protein
MRMTIRAAASITLAGLLLGPTSAIAQASPLDDMLKAATKALEVFNYRQADSISRTVLAFGSVLTKQQRALALQVSIASIYPEDKPNERQTDTARTRIKQLLAVDPSVWDRNLTWDGLDSLRALVVRASAPGKIVLGSRTPNAFLFIGDQPQGLLGSVRTIEVPPDIDVRLAIRADKCVPFDTVVRVRAADTLVVGRRNLTCTP